MATVQQSIDIRVPVHTAYNQLTQFEDYPQFMEDVDAVRQIDDTHLHWKGMMSNRAVEWDAEISEQEPDRCIAWHNTSGPSNSARVEVQALGQDASRVTVTLESEPQQVPGSPAGNSEQELAQRLKTELARLKDFVERRPQQENIQSAQGEHGSPRHSPASMSSYAAGSEGWAGDEDPSAPVTSAGRNPGAQPQRGKGGGQ